MNGQKTGKVRQWEGAGHLEAEPTHDYRSNGTTFDAGHSEREEHRIHEQAGGAFELGDLVEAGAGKGTPGGGDEGAVGEVEGSGGKSAA